MYNNRLRIDQSIKYIELIIYEILIGRKIFKFHITNLSFLGLLIKYSDHYRNTYKCIFIIRYLHLCIQIHGRMVDITRK